MTRRSRRQPAAKSVPAKLRKLREARDLTCSEAARLMVGISQAKLWQYEHGQELPTLRSLQKIADAYGVWLSVEFGD